MFCCVSFRICCVFAVPASWPFDTLLWEIRRTCATTPNSGSPFRAVFNIANVVQHYAVGTFRILPQNVQSMATECERFNCVHVCVYMCVYVCVCVGGGAICTFRKTPSLAVGSVVSRNKIRRLYRVFAKLAQALLEARQIISHK